MAHCISLPVSFTWDTTQPPAWVYRGWYEPIEQSILIIPTTQQIIMIYLMAPFEFPANRVIYNAHFWLLPPQCADEKAKLIVNLRNGNAQSIQRVIPFISPLIRQTSSQTPYKFKHIIICTWIYTIRCLL